MTAPNSTTYVGKRCIACGFSKRDAKTHECTNCVARARKGQGNE